ncbi:hypothetical protein [Salinigranum sp. GCM10025319]|uniref:hypothetical protein n=1 Tax=Salinigranum sp. GCM10025319 TaxID=3252687 RepID=UPI0036100809
MSSDVDADPEAAVDVGREDENENEDENANEDDDTEGDRSSASTSESDRASGDAASFVWTTDLSTNAADDGDREDFDDDDGGGDDDSWDSNVDSDDQDESSERPSTLSPERYLLAGETVTERVDVGRGWVAATTHRVLVFDPDSEGKRFAAVDRPNVVGIRTTDGGDPTPLAYLPRAVVYSVLLLGGGLIARSYGLRSLFSVSPGATEMPGVSGVLSMLSLAGALMGLLVDALLVGGGVAGLAALALAAWYLRSRHPTLVIERAGDDDVTLRLPAAAVGDRAVETLERVLAEELAASTAR